MNKDEVLQQIRALSDNLSRAIIQKIEIDDQNYVVKFYVATDKPFKSDDEDKLRAALRKYVQEPLSCSVSLTKVSPDCDMIRKKAYELIKTVCPLISGYVFAEHIDVVKNDVGFDVMLALSASENEFFKKQSSAAKLSVALGNYYCGVYNVSTRVIEKQMDDVIGEYDEINAKNVLEPRRFTVTDLEPLDLPTGANFATCICDCNFSSQDLSVCGIIDRASQNTSKNGKNYYVFHISDGTGRMRVTYFPKKATEDKIAKLEKGDSIICYGANSIFNGELSFTAKYINRARVPLDFVLPRRESLPVPSKYVRVKPEPYSVYSQGDMFTASAHNKIFDGVTFVVFDLETTGINNAPTVGRMDAITEIGAVKVVNGAICERFSTLINPQRRIPPNIIELTGITDEMVKDAPTISEVVADFYKFCDVDFLVGHNVMFDYRFIEYYSSQAGYFYAPKLYDTIDLVPSDIKVNNRKLNTLAEYYGFEFEHHRAFNDAAVTARLFFEFLKKADKLPKPYET